MEMALILWFVFTVTKVADFIVFLAFISPFIFALIAVVFMLIASADDSEADMKGAIIQKAKNAPYKSILAIVFVCVLVPSKDDAIIILSGTAAYEVLTSDKAKQVGGLAVDVLIEKLNDELRKEEKQQIR